jgi:hypothetical protein
MFFYNSSLDKFKEFLMSFRNIKTLAIASSIGVLLSGCAPIISGAMNITVTDQTVLDKTAAYFGVQSSEIKVSEINKSALDTSYKVVYKKTLYNCYIYYGAVTCKQPGV